MEVASKSLDASRYKMNLSIQISSIGQHLFILTTFYRWQKSWKPEKVDFTSEVVKKLIKFRYNYI